MEEPLPHALIRRFMPPWNDSLDAIVTAQNRTDKPCHVRQEYFQFLAWRIYCCGSRFAGIYERGNSPRSAARPCVIEIRTNTGCDDTFRVNSRDSLLSRRFVFDALLLPFPTFRSHGICNSPFSLVSLSFFRILLPERYIPGSSKREIRSSCPVVLL